MAGVKYYFRKDNEKWPSNYELVEKINFYGSEWEVYKNLNALPLVYSFGEVYYNERLVNDHYRQDIRVLDNVNKALRVKVSGNEILATIDLKEDSYVLLAIPYSSGWNAYVDGEKQTTMKANICYISIRVPAGAHNIKFEYSSYRL